MPSVLGSLQELAQRLEERDVEISRKLEPLLEQRDVVRREKALVREMLALEQRRTGGGMRSAHERPESVYLSVPSQGDHSADSPTSPDTTRDAGDLLVEVFRRAARPVHRTEVAPMAVQFERDTGIEWSLSPTTLTSRLTKDRGRRFRPVSGERGFWTLTGVKPTQPVSAAGRDFVASVTDAVASVTRWRATNRRLQQLEAQSPSDPNRSATRAVAEHYRRQVGRFAQLAARALDELDRATVALGDDRRLFPPAPDFTQDRPEIEHQAREEVATVERSSAATK